MDIQQRTDYLKSIQEERFDSNYLFLDLFRTEESEKDRTSDDFEFEIYAKLRKSGKDKSPDSSENEVINSAVKSALANAKKHVLLLGPPGSGKTSVCLRILHHQARLAITNNQYEIPVFVQLKRFKGSMEALIGAFFRRHHCILNNDQILEMLDKRQILIICDGVNELSSELAKNDLIEFRECYPHLPMIFSSRDSSIFGDLKIDNKFDIQPLTEDQIRAFVSKYVQNEADSFITSIKDSFGDVAHNPLLLWMIYRVWIETHEIPSNKGNIFRKFINNYINMYRQDVHANRISMRYWNDILSEIAFYMIDSNADAEMMLRISREEAEHLTGSFLKMKGIDNYGAYAITILDDLLKYHLIQSTDDDLIEFNHQLFQEYFASEKLINLIPSISDEVLKGNFLNFVKWSQSFEMMMGFIEDDNLSMKLIYSAYDIEPYLASLLVTNASIEVLDNYCDYIIYSNLTEYNKIQLLDSIRSENAVPYLAYYLDTIEDIDNQAQAIEAIRYRDGIAPVDYLFKALIYSYTDCPAELLDALIYLSENDGNRRRIIQLLSENIIDIFEQDGVEYYLQLLGYFENDEFIGILRRYLLDDSPVLRSAAAESLGRICNNSSLVDILGLLNDEDAHVRGCAVKALGQFADQISVLPLISIFENESHENKLHIITTLALVGGDNARRFIEQLIMEKDAMFVETAFRALGEIGNSQTISLLLPFLENDTDGLSKHCVNAIANIGGLSAKQVFTEYIMNYSETGDDETVENILEHASLLGEMHAIEIFNSVLDYCFINIVDDDGAIEVRSSDLRSIAIYKLFDLNSMSAMRIIAKYVDDDCNFVKASVIYAIEEYEKSHGNEKLIATDIMDKIESQVNKFNSEINDHKMQYIREHIDSPYSIQRASAIRFAIDEAVEEKIITKCFDALYDSDSEVRMAAADFMGQCNRLNAEQILLDALETEIDHGVQVQILWALNKCGSAFCVEQICQLLENDDLGGIAYYIIDKYGEPEIMPLVRNILSKNIGRYGLDVKYLLRDLQRKYGFYDYNLYKSRVNIKQHGLILNVLFVSANISDDDALQLDGEFRQLYEKIGNIPGTKDRIRFNSLSQANPSKLIEAINRFRPQIVHFSCHGCIDGRIVLLDKYQTPIYIDQDCLCELFESVNNFVRGIILNACHSSSQADSLVEYVDFAVGMNNEIEDSAAVQFSSTFYSALADGFNLTNAYKQAKTILEMENDIKGGLIELFVKKGVSSDDICLQS